MSLAKPIKMVLVSTSRFLMEGLRSVLGEETGVEIIAEMSKFEELGQALSRTHIDLIFIDHRAMNLSNRELLHLVSELSPQTKIILFEEESEGESSSPNVIRITKDTDSVKLREIVSSAFNNQALSNRMAARAHHEEEKLSKGEFKVLRLVSEGLSNKEIAKRLSIKEKTVKAHLTNIFDKLRLRSRYQIIALRRDLASRRTSRKSPPAL